MPKHKLSVDIGEKDTQRVFDALAAAYSVSADADGARAALAMFVSSTVSNVEEGAARRAEDETRWKRRAEREAAGQPVEDSPAERAADAAKRAKVDVA